MKIDETKATVAYMLAHVRLHAAGNISAWSVDDLEASFNLLPTPQVTLDDWCTRMGLDVETYEDKANKLALVQLGSMNNKAIKIEESEPIENASAKCNG